MKLKLLAVLAFVLLPLQLFAQNSARMLSGVNYQSGTTYIFQPIDATRVTSFQSDLDVSATMPAGSTDGFGVGTLFTIVNHGNGTVTITCQGCTFTAGTVPSTTFTLFPKQGADIYSDGTNYVANFVNSDFGPEITTPTTAPAAGFQLGYFKAGTGRCSIDHNLVEYCPGGGGGGSASFSAITSGTNGTPSPATMQVGAGSSLLPTSTGQVRSNFFLPSTTAGTSPGTIDFNGCSSQTPPLIPYSYIPMANGHFSEFQCIAANVSGTPAVAGVPTTVYPQWFNNSGQAYNQMGNRLIGVIFSPGLNGIITDATHQSSGIGAVWTNEFAGSSQDYDQEMAIYAEALPSGAVTNFHGHAGGEVDMSVFRGSFADRRTGFAGSPPNIFSTFSAAMSRVQAATMATSGGTWANFRAYMFNGVSGAISGTQNFTNYLSEGVDAGPCSSTGCTFYGFKAIAPTTRYANANYGFRSEAYSNNANDWNFFSAGQNTTGTATGFNAFQGPTSFGLATHAASGYQFDLFGTEKIQSTAGAALLDLFGSTSGHARIGAASAAGTPNMILLPTSTGTNGNCLITDGGNPQQTSWSACPGGGGGGTITSLNGLSDAAQTFATVNDTNVSLTINSASPTHTFTMGWLGTLAAARLNSNVVQSVVNDTNIIGSISAQALTLGWTGTLAAGRLNSNVVQAITNDTNICGTINAQNLTLGWLGSTGCSTGTPTTLAVTRGGLNLAAIAAHQVPVGTASNVYTAKTIPDCNGGTNALNFTQSGDTFSCLSIASLTNPMAGVGDMIRGGAAGTPTNLPAPTSPDNAVYTLTSTPSGGGPNAPAWSLGGITGRTVAGTSDTIVYTDRTGWVKYTSATSVAVTLPTAGSTNFGSNFVFRVIVSGAGAVTVTPNSGQIDGASSHIYNQGENCLITSFDNANYTSACSPGQITAGAGIVVTRATGGVTISTAGTTALDFTNRSTNFSSQVVAAAPTNGFLYRLTWYADVNTACTTGGNTVSFSFSWQDASAVRTETTGPLNLAAGAPSTGGHIGGFISVWPDGVHDVTASATFSGTCASGTPTFDFHSTFAK